MVIKSIFTFLFLLGSYAIANARQAPRIQIAILLDASGSMDGLIHQAQSKLWALVNEMAVAKKSGQTPKLEVALFMYGHSSLSESEGYLKCLQTLTQDLDAVSEGLFKITTNGGEEYCGAAIQAATNLNWSTNPKDYKAIFIAGNEPFTQGPTRFQNACRDAIAKGIVVNTIFCGNEEEGIRTQWKAGAELADGRYMALQHQEEMAVVHAPQDEEIMKLGAELNQTYLAFGQKGRRAMARQKKQDAQAQTLSEETAVSRTFAKASPVYKTESWDLVAAAESGAVDVAEMEADSLPDALKGKDDSEKKAYLAELSQKRTQIKQKLKTLKSQRETYIAQNRPKGVHLDDLMVNAIREQLEARQFSLPKKEQL